MKLLKVSSHLFVVAFWGICFSQPALSQSQGPLTPGNKVNSLLGGSAAWINPANAAASDNVYTTVTNGISNFLNVSNFGFTIPAGVTITGIVAEVERKASPMSPVTGNSWTTFSPPNYVSGTATAVYGATSYSYNLPVASLTNNKRLLVVTIGIENVDNIAPTNPAITFGTVTYNGVAMTMASSNSMASATTANNVAVYYLAESGLPATTGSRNLVINKTINGESAGGTISPGEYVEIVGVNTYIDVDQVNPVTAVSQTSAAATITSPTIGNVRNGDYMVAATMFNNSSGSSITQAAGYTENFEIAHDNTTTSGAMLEVESKSMAGVTGNPNVTVSATASSAGRLEMAAIAINAARVYDNSVKLMGALGVSIGSDLAVTPVNSLPNAWVDADAVQTYGGAANLWGTTLTPADINNSNFGLSFQADAANSIGSVDQIKITVYYSIPAKLSLQSFSLTQTKTEVVSMFSYNVDDNNKYTLTLERAGKDLNFTAADNVSIKDHSIQNLTLTDNNPSEGLNYYRIRIDEEGQEAQYSSVQHLIFDNKNQVELLIYPNPVIDYLVVESDQTINSITLLDVTGISVPFKITSFDTNKFKIESIAAKGSFNVLVNTDSGIISKKIIVD
jgi:hypothetical protein